MSTILAIDDKQDNLITISALLKNFLPGTVVLTALSGPDGITRARDEQPDVIILDVKMPGMDGFEVCGILKSDEKTAHIPVILLTAIKTDMNSRIRGLEIGADAFLTKPVDEAELVAQIKVMLRIKNAEDLLRKENDLLEEMVKDRTAALVQSEQKLIKERDFIRSLEDASPAYYIALDRQGSIITINRSMLEATGYELSEVTGKSYVTEFIPRTDREMALHSFNTIVKSRREMTSESRLVTRSGDEILVEWHGRPFFRKDDTLDFVFYVGIDITERKRLEKMILNSSEMERHKIGQELHERLGQNLAGLVFKSEVFRLKLKEKSPGDAAEMEEIIKLVNDAIVQTRELARDICPVDMAAGGLFMAFEELRQEVEFKNCVKCLLDLDDESVKLSDLEASNLYYIAREAVENAVQHGMSKNILITLAARENTITMKIIDDGIGLPDSFEETSGVGIRIMQYRSWIIGANFSVERNAGGGTVVTCLLRKQDDSRGLHFSESDRRKYMVENGAQKAGILIVDDHPIVRQGLSQIINREDDLYVCGEAQTADETIKLVAKLNPHLVIADISIEGASGLDLIKALRTRYSGLPVLVLSIYDELIYAERTLRAGARGYVMKQEAPQTVVTAIRTVLSGKQYLSAQATADLINRMPYEGRRETLSTLDCLTIREFEVFQYIGNGLGNRHIAEKLNISVKTVENYRERIKNKLNLDSASDMVQYAVQWVIDKSKNRKNE